MCHNLKNSPIWPKKLRGRRKNFGSTLQNAQTEGKMFTKDFSHKKVHRESVGSLDGKE